jgi:glycine/D-amino acid oxidase-like deaminating enzyme
MLFGGLSNYTGLEPANVTEIMREKMINVFPALKTVNIDYKWSGQMAVSLRRIPQMGRLQGNVLYVGGYSGHGVAPTHIMGRIIAEAIDGNSERFDIMAKITHYPWPGGKLLRRPAMAAGMMCYKIMDVW